MITGTAFCLAIAIYFEARSEPIAGQVAVAQVILNNVNWNEKRVCKKVYQKGFLSSLNIPRKIPNPRNKHWIVAQDAARVALLLGKQGDITKGANHFDMVNANPYWKKHCKVTLVIAGHFFCKGG